MEKTPHQRTKRHKRWVVSSLKCYNDGKCIDYGFRNQMKIVGGWRFSELADKESADKPTKRQKDSLLESRNGGCQTNYGSW